MGIHRIFGISMAWPHSHVAGHRHHQDFYHPICLHLPLAITGNGGFPMWVTGGSRYLASQKWWLGYYLPLEMLPFLGGIRLFSWGVYTFFLSCDSYPSNMSWQSWLSKANDFWFNIGEGKGGDINGFFSMKEWAVDVFFWSYTEVKRNSTYWDI